MATPVLIKSIPTQIVNEHAAYGPFNLNDFIRPGSSEDPKPQFSAMLENGESLPAGMICTADGLLTGIPAEGTQGIYPVIVTANVDDEVLETPFILTIKPNLATTGNEYFDQLKTQIWEALEKNLPIEGLDELSNRPITPLDVYYLLMRFGTLKAWDAFNLDPPGTPVPLTLEGVSPHYRVFDRGSCIVAVPKDLFSHERTLADGIMTAKAVAREVYKRNWTTELVGVDQLTRAAWVEIQHLGDQYGRALEVINFTPLPMDRRLYAAEVRGHFNLEGPE